MTSYAESDDTDATQLMQTLKSLGISGYSVANGAIQTIQLKGSVTITNGAACDNGHRTYDVDLTEVDANGKTIRTYDIDHSNGCQKPSAAENFNDLLDRWGGSTLDGDCGLGHCWYTIRSITCTHYGATSYAKAIDSCSVELSNDD